MPKWIVMTLIGILLMGLGIMNMKGDISSVHWYNRSKVAQEDIPKYGKCIGFGTFLIGASLAVSVLLETVFPTVQTDPLALAGCACGLGIMFYGQFKYNKGIF